MQSQFNLLRVCMALLLIIVAGLVPHRLVQSEANAAQVTFRWDYTASGAAGFALYCGTSSKNYPTRVDVGNTDTYTIGTLAEGAISFCAVTAYDPAKVESSFSNEVSVFVPPAAPVVNFNAAPASGAAPLSVAFGNTTTGQVTTWAWNFGDGTTSNVQSPTHVYSTPGSYIVVLTATGAGGTASKTAATAISVSAAAPPVVNFSASPASGAAPLSVAFINTTTGPVTTWAWNFGDGTTSNAQNPTHVYSTPGSYTVVLTATGAGGMASKTAATAISVTTQNTPPPTGLVAAYSFNEGTGTTVADASGNKNTGSVNGATWTTQGRFGAALSFDGVSNLVQIPSSASLNVSSAMTLEAWVYPTASQNRWRTIMQREGDTSYLYAGSDSGPLWPAGGGTFNGTQAYVSGTTANPVNAWTHLALTYDGATLRLYVNGVLAASEARTGAVQTSSNPLRIGGSSYGEFFQGRIDEVRLYNRALSKSEIQTDMNAPVGAVAADTTAPSAPAGLTATAVGSSQIALAWGASTDNVGVSGYRVERCQGTGCTTFAQVATSSTTSFSNTGLSASTSYSFRVRATDAAGNLSSYSTVASVTTPAGASANGLVAAYSFNEGTGTTVADVSGNNNVGSVNGATWTTLGRFGTALTFNGVSNLVLIPSSASLSVSAAMTLEAWIYPTAAQSGWRTIMQREVDASFLYAGSDTGPLWPAGGGTFNGTVAYVSGTTANPLNTWTHMALTYDGATLRLYVNGVLAASQARIGTVHTSSNPLRIGGSSYGEFFQGRIDEVRLYNRALSQSEIQTDMNAPVAP